MHETGAGRAPPGGRRQSIVPVWVAARGRAAKSARGRGGGGARDREAFICAKAAAICSEGVVTLRSGGEGGGHAGSAEPGACAGASGPPGGGRRRGGGGAGPRPGGRVPLHAGRGGQDRGLPGQRGCPLCGECPVRARTRTSPRAAPGRIFRPRYLPPSPPPPARALPSSPARHIPAPAPWPPHLLPPPALAPQLGTWP